MLRGMRKASSNWLGRIVMGVLLGLIAISFAIWGIGDIFRGFGQSTVAKIGGTEIRVDSSARSTTTGCSSSAASRPPDHAGQARLARPRPAAARPAGRRSRARRACPPAPARHLRRRDRARILNDPSFRGIDRPVRPHRFEQLIRRPASPSRASSPSSAAYLLRQQIADTVDRRDGRAQDRGRRAQPLPERAAQRSTTSCSTARRPATFRAPTPGSAREIFRRAQGAVPRARIPQGRCCWR